MQCLKRRAPQLSGFLRKFRDDEGGNIAIILGLTIVVLMISIGAAVDVARWLNARNQTVAAIDGAVLAGGRALQIDSDDRGGAVAAAEKYYTQNVSSRLPVVNDTVTFAVADDGMGIAASGNAYIRTPFLQFANVEKLPLMTGAETEFAKSHIAVGGNGGQNVEVSLILDVTGSMKGQKIEDLKAAAKDLIDIVIWEDQSEFTSKIAVVPYSMAVNVGTYAEKVRGTIKSGKSSSPGSQQYEFTNAQGNKKTFTVSTCVTERTGTNAYNEVPPSSQLLGKNYPAPTNPCLQNTIVPLSTNKDALKASIDALKASGSTAGHIGVAWGWYMLSPNFGYLWPASQPEPYSDLTASGPKGQPLLKKIAILMTDGEYNSSYCKGVISKDSTNGSGDPADHINCNASNGHSFDQAKKVCTNMKKTGITVYTVGFDVVDDQRARELVSDCATDPTKVYMAEDGEQLRSAFRDIALKLSSLYLSR